MTCKLTSGICAAVSFNVETILNSMGGSEAFQWTVGNLRLTVAKRFNKRLKTVDRVIDAASNTFRVRLELRNPGGALPACLRCKVNLGLNLPEAAVRDPRSAGQRSTKANPADNRLPAGSLATAATTARR